MFNVNSVYFIQDVKVQLIDWQAVSVFRLSGLVIYTSQFLTRYKTNYTVTLNKMKYVCCCFKIF